MAGTNELRAKTADTLLEAIRATADGEDQSSKLQELAEAFSLVSNATGGRDKQPRTGSQFV